MTLHFYFARRYLWMFLMIFGIFALFQGLLDLIEEMRRFDDSVSFGQVVQVTLMKLPSGVYEIVPLVMILVAIFFVVLIFLQILLLLGAF